MYPNVCERRHEVRTGRGEKGLCLGRTRSRTRQARWPESHRQGNGEGRHAFRSGSHRVEISIRFDLTLESVPGFRLFSRRTAHAFGTIGASIGRKYRYVKALRASWTLASTPAHGRKLPRVSSDISAEGGTESKGFDSVPPSAEMSDDTRGNFLPCAGVEARVQDARSALTYRYLRPIDAPIVPNAWAVLREKSLTLERIPGSSRI